MKERKSKRRSDRKWYLYILRCKDGSLYTGVTVDLERRFKMHRDGRASRYTRVRRPLRLVYREYCGNRTDALVRECVVKEIPKAKKEELVQHYGATGKKSGRRSRKRKGKKI